MGRSRGGLTTKIHALVDANGLPVVLKLTEGQAHDGSSAADMLGGIGADQTLLADRAYDSNALGEAMTRQYHPSSLSGVLRRMGFSRQKTRPSHPRTDPAAQARWVKRGSPTR